MKRGSWIGAAALFAVMHGAIPAHAQGAPQRCLRLQDDYRRALMASTDALARRKDARSSAQGQCSSDHAAAIRDAIKTSDSMIKTMRGMRNCMASGDERGELDRKIREARMFHSWDRRALASVNVDCRWRRQ
jgi:hypothetical protein